MNVKGAGRKNKYDSHIKPYLKKISEMAKNKTESDIAKELGITIQTLCGYKKEHPELVDALRKGQQSLVSELRSALIKKALGYTYQESDTEITIDAEGNERKKKIIHERYSPEDTGAIHLLLKNYDRDNWSNDWKSLEIKQAQLEIDKRLADLKAQGW